MIPPRLFDRCFPKGFFSELKNKVLYYVFSDIFSYG
ncbi:hypothetical protein B23_1857 [Geobacillus thermoleovorans B23]|nr:hypothetical protein B23_1857 [Geobacillus thermoleovorans B23]